MKRENPLYPTSLIVSALLANDGLILAAAKQIGCNANTIRARAKSNITVRQAITEGRMGLVDIAEERLKGALERDEPWALALVVKTLGKDRGYVERQEQVHNVESMQVVTRVVHVKADD